MTPSEATALDHLLEKFKGRPFSAAQAARLGIYEKTLRKLVSQQAIDPLRFTVAREYVKLEADLSAEMNKKKGKRP